jgi:hypothetical protein
MTIGRRDFLRISALSVAVLPLWSALAAIGVPQGLERRGPSLRVIVHADAGAAAIADHHAGTLQYVRHFGLELESFLPTAGTAPFAGEPVAKQINDAA